MPVVDNENPFLSFNFQVEIGDQIVGGFSEVTGLQIEIVVETYQEGGVQDYEHKFAGRTRYPTNLIFKHGLTDSNFMWTWCDNIRKNNIERKNGTVYLLDGRHQPIIGWDFLAAYPVKWIGPELRADSNTIAFESIEFAHRGIIKSI